MTTPDAGSGRADQSWVYTGSKRPSVPDPTPSHRTKRARHSSHPIGPNGILLKLPRQCHKEVKDSMEARKKWVARRINILEEKYGLPITYVLLEGATEAIFRWGKELIFGQMLDPQQSHPVPDSYPLSNALHSKDSLNVPAASSVPSENSPVEPFNDNQSDSVEMIAQESLANTCSSTAMNRADEGEGIKTEDHSSTDVNHVETGSTQEDTDEDSLYLNEVEGSNEGTEASEISDDDTIDDDDDDDDVVEIAAEEFHRRMALNTNNAPSLSVPDEELEALSVAFVMKIQQYNWENWTTMLNRVYADEATFSYQINDAPSFETLKVGALTGKIPALPEWLLELTSPARKFKNGQDESDRICTLQTWTNSLRGTKMSYELDAEGKPVHGFSVLTGPSVGHCSCSLLTLHGTASRRYGAGNVSFDRSLVLSHRNDPAIVPWHFQILSEHITFRWLGDMPPAPSLTNLDAPRCQKDGTVVRSDRFDLISHLEGPSVVPKIRLPVLPGTVKSNDDSMQCSTVLVASTSSLFLPSSPTRGFPHEVIEDFSWTGQHDARPDSRDSEENCMRDNGHVDEFSRMRAELKRLQVHSLQLQRELEDRRNKHHPVAGASL